jgi:starch synthase
MKILFLAAEIAPFVKVGGLADVAGSLPLALAELGHDVRLAMPRYYVVDPNKWGLRKIIETLDVPIGIGTTSIQVLEGELPNDNPNARVPVYFIQNQHHFERDKVYGYADDGDRFAVYCRGVMIMLKSLDWRPDVIHANDWHTALCINYLKTIYRDDPFFAGVKSVFTIHNLAYQGVLSPYWLGQAGLSHLGLVWGDRDGMVNIMGRGIAYADAVSTVSPTYASEILTPQYGEGLDWLLNYRWGHLWGILNGIDYNIFNPSTDPYLISHYTAKTVEKREDNKTELQARLGLPVDPNIPIIGMVSRLADQKGFDLVASSAERILEKGVQLIVLGTGEYGYHEFLYWLSHRFNSQVRAILGFHADIAPKIYAGSDMFLMPSRFEPCGLGQLIAMRYGSIPVVRHTGGLVDTVQEYYPDSGAGNGFSFGSYEPVHLLSAIDRALAVYHQPSLWQELIGKNMQRDYSWTSSAQQYLNFYRQELGLS